MSIIFIANILALLLSFFVVGTILGAFVSHTFRKKLLEFYYERRLSLLRSLYNPILRPGAHPWTAEAVLNPAAAFIDGRTHLVYRAVGMDGVSRLGYASSPDGLLFNDRPPYPIYIAQKDASVPAHLRQYSPVLYPSGGSWGGCEDPRMVVIDNRVYVTFNMFENWVLRVGCVSMPVEDFLAKRFHKWSPPIVLSHGNRDKNWVLFPEKLGGKFAVLHSIIGDTPDRVRIEYVDALEDLRTRTFKSPDPQQHRDEHIAWHTHVRSAGAPPLRTEIGWLVFYHAHDAREPHRYKIGALLLDLDDPTKIRARAVAPVLEPDAAYENDGKPGVVYACGATVNNKMLHIYYGGADKVVCVATAPLDAFVNALAEGSAMRLSSGPTFSV